MLETIREYGLERLAAGEEAALRDRHARYFLDLAKSAPPYVPETRLGDWYGRVDLERDNLRAALAWADARDDVALLARLAAALWPYWREYLRVAEGRRWLEAVLARGSAVPPARRAAALTGACALAFTQTDYAAARAHGQDALTLWRQLGDHRGQAVVRQPLGWVSAMLGRPEQAIDQFTAALRAWRRVGEPRGIARALSDLALATTTAGDLAVAAPYLRGAEALYRATRDDAGLARALRDRGLHALLGGDVAGAVGLLAESVERLRAAGRTYLLPAAVLYLGTARCFAGALDDAATCYAESLRLREAIGDQAHLALTVLGLAAVAHRQGDGVRAARLCGAAQALQRAHRLALPPAVAALYEREIGLVRGQVGAEAFSQAFAEGSDLTTAAALAFAREGVADPGS